MKKILITGKNSYIGTSVENWLMKEPDKYHVDTIDMKDGSWKEKDFSKYDVVFHVAGIAHVSSDPKLQDLYYKVNRDLTVEAAEKAKAEGVKQFIFMSSMIIYGANGKIGESKIITKDTVPEPSDFYGDSKLQAENGILPLQNENFKIVVIRPPMIYGKGSKGNYPKLSKLAKITPIFPDIDNERSMLHIDNLCEFIKLMVENKESGLFFPQNGEYVKTSELVKIIAHLNGEKVMLIKIKGLNFILKVLGCKFEIFNKIFGSIVYDKNDSKYKYDYQIRNFITSINKTEI